MNETDETRLLEWRDGPDCKEVWSNDKIVAWLNWRPWCRDRGEWVVRVALIYLNEADDFPRYYMHEAVARSETEAFLRWRLWKESPETKKTCITCRFYRDLECRRRAPVQSGRFDFHFGELLEAIAVAQLKLADMEDYYKDDSMHAINTEATEAFQRSVWPRVEEDDWCGEYERGIPKEV